MMDSIDLGLWLSRFFDTWKKTFHKVKIDNLSFIGGTEVNKSLDQKKEEATEAYEKLKDLIDGLDEREGRKWEE